MKYKAVIIGCGSIGALKPDKFDSPNSKNVLTHANAIFRNLDMELIGFIDSDISKLKSANRKWALSRGRWDSSKADIIVVSTPTETHKSVIDNIIDNLNPKIVIAEKPLCNNLRDCNNISKRSLFPIAVNYNRRFEPRHQEIAKAMDHLSRTGQIYGCRVMYGRGLMRDGCHALDLMRWWFGNMITAKKTNVIVDSQYGPSTGFVSEYEKCKQVVFTPVDSRKVGLFEINIITGVGEYRLTNNGTKLKMRSVVQGDEWGNYPTLGGSSLHQKTMLTNTLPLLYDNVLKYLRGEAKLKCISDDALKVWEDYEKIMKEEK